MSLTTRCLVLVGFLVCAAQSQAQPSAFGDVDTEAARTHYARGRDLYEEGQYREAIAEFETARTILRLPALVYNIALCEERLEHWARAAELYEHFLEEAPVTADTPSIRRRVEVLRARIDALRPADKRGLHIAAIAMAAGTVALGAVATGVYLSPWSSYSDKEGTCHGACSTAEVHGLSTRIDRAEKGGYALWALTGVAAVTDVVLWVVDAKQRRATRETKLAAVPGGVRW